MKYWVGRLKGHCAWALFREAQAGSDELFCDYFADLPNRHPSEQAKWVNMQRNHTPIYPRKFRTKKEAVVAMAELVLSES